MPGRLVVVAAALLVGGVVLGATALVARVADEPFAYFTRDVVATAGLPPYAGALATLNAMVWAATGGISAFAAWARPAERLRLGGFAVLALLLAADEALLLHESVGPTVGLPEPLFYAAYAAAALLVSWRMLRGDRATGLAYLLGAVLLGVSVAADVLLLGVTAYEDAAKLLGACVWATVPLLAWSAGTGRDGDRDGGTPGNRTRDDRTRDDRTRDAAGAPTATAPVSGTGG